ncbi:MAG: DUF4962 domain-containing protein [Kiritimatiellaeota bacterium]|nr:DUF4962 domain-containing protein [Kiritimatiellota bacterium]
MLVLTVRGMAFPRTCLAAFLLSVLLFSTRDCPAAGEGAERSGRNLLRNAGFEQLDKDGRPEGWESVDFRTAGKASVSSARAHTGKVCVRVAARAETERVCWRQKVALPSNAGGVEVRAWYRTEGVVDSSRGRGASIRVLFHRSLQKWDEISLQQSFFPASKTWREAHTMFRTPAGTRAVVVELFHWRAPGATHWDDVFLRTVSANKVVQAMNFKPGTEIDRPPVPGRNLPYTPADGAVVETDPPPFLWLPSGRDTHRYFLEVSPNDRFDGPETRRYGPTRWCCMMLEKRLGVGAWYWRYGAQPNGLDKPAWSRARRFAVPEGATPWVYPGRDAFQVAKPRPHLLLSAARVPELRRRAASGDLHSIARSLARRVRREVGKPLPPEPDFLPEDRTKRSPAYVKIFRATRPPMDMMERAALAYLLTGERAFGLEAKRRVLHFFAWDPQGSTSVFHNDEPAMWVMMRGVRAYDWTYDLFTPEERARVENVMRIRARDFYLLLRRMPFENNPFSSHPGRIIGFLGEVAIEFLPDWPEAREWLDYITRIFWGVYPAWGKEDGGWNEGPGYWAAYMTFAMHFVLALREACGVDLMQRPFFRNTPYYRLYLTPPYSNMAPFGDGTQFTRSRPVGLMYDFSSLLGDSHIRWYCDAVGHPGPTSDVLGILLKDDSIQGRAPFELPQARFFPGVGLVCLHTDFAVGENNVEFALRSSPYGAVSHGHNDQNSFVLEAYGEPLAIASGYYNYYGSPHHDKWTRRTKAKCGITYDGGQGQDRGWQARGRIAHYVHGESFDAVVGDAVKAYGGRLTRAVREVVHVRPGVFVIRDDLAAPEPHRFEYWLHALDKMEVDESKCEVRIRRPKASLTVQFLEPANLRFRQTDEFDPPPKWPPNRKYADNWHLTASLAAPADSAQILTVLLPVKNGAENTLPSTRRLGGRKGAGVELRFPDGRRVLVVFALPGETAGLEVAGLHTDARIAALGMSADGRIERVLMVGGTKLAWGGRRLVAAGNSRPVRGIAASFGASGGRIDIEGPEYPELRLLLPQRPFAVTDSAANPIPSRFEDDTLLLPASGPTQVVLWAGRPAAPGATSLTVQVGDRSEAVRAVRYGRDRIAVDAPVSAGPGLYSVDAAGQPGVEWFRPRPDAQGRVWVKNSVRLRLRARGPVGRVVLRLERAVAVLEPRPQSALPTTGMVSIEAERGVHERGGKIRMSGGGHAGTSGSDNLWAWNTPGHALWWDVAVPETGRYELWVVGASETGLLAEVRVGEAPPVAVLFQSTGGWGRRDPKQWRAFLVRTPQGTPVRFKLAAGKRRLELANRSGLGLNLDRFVLARVR